MPSRNGWWLAFLLIALLMPRDVAAQSPPKANWPLRLSFLAAGAAHGMDLSTTAWCRAQERCHEANPALRWAQDSPLALGAGKMTVASLSLLATYELSRHHHPRWAFWLNVGQALTFSAIARHNARFAPSRP